MPEVHADLLLVDLLENFLQQNFKDPQTLTAFFLTTILADSSLIQK